MYRRILATLEHCEFILLLMSTPGIGDRTLKAILRRNAIVRRSPEEFLSLSSKDLIGEYELKSDVAESLRRRSHVDQKEAEAGARWLRRNEIALLTCNDATYPRRLFERMDDPPAVLFAYGNASLLQSPLFAVANSNGAPEDLLAAGDRAVEDRIAGGWALVTGHNRIGYQRPALAARRNGGKICYVLDRGLVRGFGNDLTQALFPAARIWGPAYDPKTDLTISSFGLNDHGIAANNRRRDAIVFALADEILAGWVRPGGQMEAECMAALLAGRSVRLIAGPNASLEAAGATRGS